MHDKLGVHAPHLHDSDDPGNGLTLFLMVYTAGCVALGGVLGWMLRVYVEGRWV